MTKFSIPAVMLYNNLAKQTKKIKRKKKIKNKKSGFLTMRNAYFIDVARCNTYFGGTV